MELREFGRSLEKQFGWDFARLTTPTSSWDKIKKALGIVFKKLHGEDWLGEAVTTGLRRGKSIEDAVRDILLSNRNIQPDEMVVELKASRYSEEDINEFLGPRGKK